MSEIFVCRSTDIPEGNRRIIEADGLEIGIYHQGGRYYAYRNLCAHQGGPACEGELLPRVKDVVGKGGLHLGQEFDETDLHIVCPWHSYEFKLSTGECVADRTIKLKRYEVFEREGAIYVQL